MLPEPLPSPTVYGHQPMVVPFFAAGHVIAGRATHRAVLLARPSRKEEQTVGPWVFRECEWQKVVLAWTKGSGAYSRVGFGGGRTHRSKGTFCRDADFLPITLRAHHPMPGRYVHSGSHRRK